jgi:hypothetical protein
METFADLPDALVRDLLDKAMVVAADVGANLKSLRLAKRGLRQHAEENGLICRKSDLEVTREPSVVGIDGSYQIHHLTAVDLCAAAAVAVEGTTKEAKRYWPQPYHEMWVDSLPHAIDSVGVLRGMMISMELNLSRQAPHDLVLLDGSFASLVIYLNQGLSKLEECAPSLSQEFLRRWDDGLFTHLLSLLKSDRVSAIAKFTSRNELLPVGLGTEVEVDGKTLATLILNPGEYIRPVPMMQRSDQNYHLPTTIDHGRHILSQDDNRLLDEAMRALKVVYFRPYGWLPAIRLELPSAIANSNAKLSLALEGITRQLFTPAVFEPYPLFLADRMVKSLGAGVAVIEQSVAQDVVDNSPDVETTMLFLQNYRTEGGRG